MQHHFTALEAVEIGDEPRMTVEPEVAFGAQPCPVDTSSDPGDATQQAGVGTRELSRQSGVTASVALR